MLLFSRQSGGVRTPPGKPRHLTLPLRGQFSLRGCAQGSPFCPALPAGESSPTNPPPALRSRPAGLGAAATSQPVASWSEGEVEALQQLCLRCRRAQGFLLNAARIAETLSGFQGRAHSSLRSRMEMPALPSPSPPAAPSLAAGLAPITAGISGQEEGGS